MLEREAQSIGDELGDRRRVPLPLRREAHGAPGRPVGIHGHRGRLDTRHLGHPAQSEDRRAHSGVLGVARDADADKATRGALFRLRPPQLLVPDRGQHLLERLGEVAAVVGQPGRRLERVRLAREEVAPPDLGRVEARALGDEVEHALHDERAHRHADAAIGPERRLVRGQGPRVVFVRQHPVRTGQDARGSQRLERRRGRIRVIRARIGHDARPDRQQRAVGRRGDLDRRPPFTRLRRRRQILTALLDPFHRPLEHPRERRHRDVFGEDLHLESEAAADVGRHDPDAHFREVEGRRQRGAEERRALARRPQRQRLAVPVRHHAARLHRHGGAPAVRERLANDERRARESSIDVTGAMAPVEDDAVRGQRLVQRRDGG